MHHGNVSPEIAQGLIELKKRIEEAKIPSSKLDETINVAIWNIREFGKVHRTVAAIHFIAEILGQFDLIAIVELRADLTDLGRVLPILGPSWDVIYSDWIDDSGGNMERTAFLFDRRAVTFNGLAAEVDAPREKIKTEYLSSQSFWRAPYMCSFRSGNFDFIAIASHARWGTGTEGRKAELQMLADWIDNRFNDKYVEDHDLIVMGDFNIPEIDDELFKALTCRGLKIPDTLRNLKNGDQLVGGSNLNKNARYDQILHLPTMDKRFSNKGGTLDFFKDVNGIKKLFLNSNYKINDFSFQISDHFPIWVQINVDIEDQHLDQILQDGNKKP
jgi:endonuclease/exonuclease/phosphatase family metal-dependent hydrolase